MLSLFKKYVRATFLVDFFSALDKRDKCWLMFSLFFSTTQMTIIRVSTPLLLACAASKAAGTQDSSISSFKNIELIKSLSIQDLFALWAVMKASEPLLRELNNILIAYLDRKFMNKIIGTKLMEKFHTTKMVYSVENNNIPVLIKDATVQISGLMNLTINEFWPLVFTTILASLAFNANVSGKFLSVMSTMLLLYAGFAFVISTKKDRAQAKITAAHTIFAEALQEDLDNMSTIRAHNRSRLHCQHELRLFQKTTKKIESIKQMSAKGNAIRHAFFIASNLGLLYWLNPSSINQLDDAIIITTYFGIFREAIDKFFSNIISMQSAIDHIDAIRSFYDPAKKSGVFNEALSRHYRQSFSANSADTPYIHPPLSPGIPVIQFKHVTYIAAGNTVLDNVSFTIENGDTCALIGDSDNVKSSVLSLLCGLYQPNSGEIWVRGINITQRVRIHIDEDHATTTAHPRTANTCQPLLTTRPNNYRTLELPSTPTHTASDMTMDYLRSLIGWMPLETHVFLAGERKNRLAFNMMYADFPDHRLAAIREGDTLTPQEITALTERKAAVELLDVTDNTLTRPSCTEKQKIGLARVWGERRITLLDEPTSALDPLAEQRMIEKFNRSRTPLQEALIIAARRSTTIESCRKILFFSGGRLQEQGNHEELMARGEGYAALYMTQARARSF